MSGDAGELLGETFGYGGLFCAGFRGALGGSEGDWLVGGRPGVPAGQRFKKGPEALRVVASRNV